MTNACLSERAADILSMSFDLPQKPSPNDCVLLCHVLLVVPFSHECRPCTADTRTNRLPKNPGPGNRQVPDANSALQAGSSRNGLLPRPGGSCRSQDDGTVVRHRNRVLEVGGQ